MDKMKKYQKTIVGLLEELAAHSYANAPGIQRQVIADPVHHHYQLISIGWHKGIYHFNPLLHFDLRNGKIWVQQNDTEIEIGDELIARGVSPKDIVLGFLPEQDRALVKFAVPA
jgi:hypothetical protein